MESHRKRIGVSSRPAILSNAVMVLGLWAGALLLQRFRLVEYIYLTLEDGWIEYGSFAAWVLAALFFALAFIRARNTRRLAYLALALGAFFMAMEEISWGQRIIGWGSPGFFKKSNLQSETNLHNLVRFTKVYRPLATALVVWCVVPWSLMSLVPRLRQVCDRWAIPIVSLRTWPWFFLAAAFLAEHFMPRPHELGELFLAMAVAVLALDTLIAKEGGVVPRVPLSSVPVITVSILLVMTAVVTPVLPGPPKRAFGRHLNRVGYQRLTSGQPSQAVLVFDYIASHPKHRKQDSQLFHSMALRDLGRTDEARQALVGYQGLYEVEILTGLEDTGKLPSPERALRWGLALCVIGQSTEARTLSKWIESRERGRLAEAGSAREEGEIRYQISAALLAQGFDKKAGRELKKAAKRVRRRHERALRSRYRNVERLVELAGCQ